MAKKPKQQPIPKKEKVADLSPEDIARIKAIVYKGVPDICWISPIRPEVKALIKIAEAYFSVMENKDNALEHALNRLETIQHFSGRKDFEGVNWESNLTQTRIKKALEWKGFEP